MSLDMREIGLTIHDVIDGDTTYLAEYLKIYTNYLPQYSRYVPVMQRRAAKPVDIYALERWHQWLVMYDEKPVAMIGFLYNRKRNLGILMDFAVVEDMRDFVIPGNGRFAGELLFLAMEQLKHDAEEIGNPTPLCMAAEVEHTPLVERYTEYGFVEFPIEYYEPPGTPELAQLVETQDFESVGYRRLFLGAFQMPNTKLDPTDMQVVDIILHALFEDHYQLPEEWWLFFRIEQSVELGELCDDK